MNRDLLEKFTRHRSNFHKSAPLMEIRIPKKTVEQLEQEDNKPVLKKSLGYSDR